MFETLNSLVARERSRELLDAAAVERARRLDSTPVTRVTLRQAVAADAKGLRVLAELDSAQPPTGSTLVAEVDGRLRAALPLNGGCPIADPFYRGAELVELLRMRAAQLSSS